MDIHTQVCDLLIKGVFDEQRLDRVEAQSAELTASASVDSTSLNAYNTMTILSQLGFGGGDAELALLHPLQLTPASYNGPRMQRYHTPRDDLCSRDPLRAKVSFRVLLCWLLSTKTKTTPCRYNRTKQHCGNCEMTLITGSSLLCECAPQLV